MTSRLALAGALWMALRALEEKSALSRRMAETGSPHHRISGSRFRAIAADAETAGETIRRLIARLGSTTSPNDPGESAAAASEPR